MTQANQCDLYLYLDKDAPYVQDGTRLTEDDRNTLDSYHKNTLKKHGINYHLIQGNWDERFNKCVEAVKNMFSDL
ncbi:AAA family ATPase [Marinilabiliaceae bacterium AAT]|uniref:AAA family ATPase n=1 Tax=Plebeiibacterium sediminum TaxID=2992112 RepID=A0AAE3M377_9BACT|nr:AAA family ATPase [Plebeiobacterium sediminum]MCW3786009.1 AAA family ATPase [Plebeiobacterium sediminum]